MFVAAAMSAAAVGKGTTALASGTPLEKVIEQATRQLEVNQGELRKIDELIDGLTQQKARAEASAIRRIAAEAKAIAAMIDRVRKRKSGPQVRERRFMALLSAARFVQGHPGESFEFQEWFVEVSNAMWPDGDLIELRTRWENKDKVQASLGPDFDESVYTKIARNIAGKEKKARPRIMQAIRLLQDAGHLAYDVDAGKITHLNSAQ